jgi:hypothetical protein
VVEPAFALGHPLLDDPFEFFLQMADSRTDHSSVGFNLRLTRAFGSDAAKLFRKMRPLPGQPRKEVLKLGKLNLSFGFICLCPGSEDVKNQPASIEHFTLQDFLEIAILRPGQIVVEDDKLYSLCDDEFVKFLDFSLSDEGGSVDPVPVLTYPRNDLGTSRICQERQLVEVFLCLLASNQSRRNAYNDTSFFACLL